MTDTSTHGERPTKAMIQELLSQGWSMQQAGDLRRARRLYRRALELDPVDADANVLMGRLWIESGQPGDAVPCLERALTARPGHPQALFNLGLAMLQLGRLEHARDCFVAVTRSDSSHLEAHIHLGMVCLDTGDLDVANRALMRVHELQPDHAGALFGLGLLNSRVTQHAEAERYFRQVIHLEPENVDALRGLGAALVAQNREEEALAWLEKAVEAQPRSAAARNGLGSVLRQLERSDEALAQFRQALSEDPSHLDARMNLGLTLEQTGRIDEAERVLADTVAQAPGFADARFRLARLPGRVTPEREIEEMRQLLDPPDVADPVRCRLAFALGYALESAGRYEEAFDSFRLGHEIRARTIAFDRDAAERALDNARQYFTRARIVKLQAAGVPDERPILVIGLPRSGAGLVEQILASHPLVYGAGESPLLGQLVSRLFGLMDRYPEGLEDLPAATLRDQTEIYLEGLGRRAGSVQRICDTTSTNLLHLGLAASLLPDARFILCHRDPMDNCVSIYRHLLPTAHSYAHDLADLGHYCLAYQRLVAHWRQVLSGRVFEVVYENLVNEPERQIRDLLGFCGMPNHGACHAFHENRRLVRTPSAAQVHQPLDTGSIGAWRKYEKQVGELTRILRPGD